MSALRALALFAFFLLSTIGLLGSIAIAQVEDGVRASTGGAQTLEDIIARQNGLQIDDEFRRANTGDPSAGAAITMPLGTMGGISDPEIWRSLRYGSANVSASAGTPGATLLVQDDGMQWLQIRAGPLRTYGGYLLLAVIALLAVFMLLRGRIRIEGEKSGEAFLRFNAVERFGHWLLAGSFILLGISGLITLFGRVALIPIFGKEAFSVIALASKWVHNNVSWAFMAALVLVFVCWVIHNVPNRADLIWLAKGGGLFTKGTHPPARKFNAGQKIVFWAVIILGASISASGLSLLFPFEYPMFAVTFEKMNALGIPGLLNME
ncbi:MAG: cytochrome b/b6 domain-containing protein, partial [Albidovulum sp.]|nr:cytochrome b/b6 domain-containing protein [Albidovulum sp.]